MKKNKGLQRKKREKHVGKGRGASLTRAIKLRVKKGDKVRILSGKDKGKTGEVLKALPRENKVVVEGVGMVKRHLKRSGKGQSGRIVERPMPVHASNVVKI